MEPGKSDDPLERLAADEDWRDRVRSAERDAAKARRKAKLRIVRPRARRTWQRGSRSGRGISWIFFALLALMAGSGAALWTDFGPPSLMVFVFVLSTWLVALCLHEFSHALTAHHGGDDTIEGKGYLRLDIRRYGHPILTFGLPILFLIMGGLPLPGGAVLVETHRLRNRFRDALVSAAGPAVNIVFAAVLLVIVGVFGPDWISSASEPRAAFWAALTFSASLQVITAILNLLPVPGLDGWGIIEPYMSGSVRYTANKIKPFGILIVLVLLYLPGFRPAFFAAADFWMDLASAPVNGDYFGYRLFQFWRS